ncbi:MAG: ankyrin repeat protein [Gammaproteobacteria bacterium]|jgi:hypothetical protein|nr:ankyrin repeat protein [Gammaproteobacteria bacterium]
MSDDDLNPALEDLKRHLDAGDSRAIIAALQKSQASNELSLNMLQALDDTQRWKLIFTLLEMLHQKKFDEELDALRDEHTALFQAVMEIDPSLVNQKNRIGAFPLMYAIERDNFNLVKLLIHCGANPNQTYHLSTPMAYAIALKKDPRFLDQLKTIKEFNESNKTPPKVHPQQTYLIRLGNLLGYPTDQQGICHGISLMGIQAFFLLDDEGKNKGLEEFNNRIHRIKEISPEKHVENLARARNKMKQKGFTREELTADEKIALDLPAFYEGIELYQQSTKNPALYEDGIAPILQEPEPSIALAMSTELENAERGGMTSVQRFSGVYNTEEMEEYFSALRLLAQEKNIPLALNLSAGGHSIVVAFNPQEDEFILIDANRLPSQHFKKIDEIAKITRASFDKENRLTQKDSLVISTTVFSLGIHKKAMTTLCDSWMQHLGAIHHVTPAKAKFRDKTGRSWKEAALHNGEVELYTALRETEGNFFYQHRKLLFTMLAISMLTGIGIVASIVTLGIAPAITTIAFAGAALVSTTALAAMKFTVEKQKLERQKYKENFMHKINESRNTMSQVSVASRHSVKSDIQEKMDAHRPPSAPKKASNDPRFFPKETLNLAAQNPHLTRAPITQHQRRR